MALPDACRAIRSLQDVSQDEFAKRIGVNRKVIKLLESGKGNPRHESLERIARSAGLRIAFVADRPVVGLMNSRKRLSEENAQRDADAKALKQGMPEKTMYQRNAMRLGDVKLKLPKIG
jgi:transcriptional regulator with XRE-family HTH domain